MSWQRLAEKSLLDCSCELTVFKLLDGSSGCCRETSCFREANAPSMCFLILIRMDEYIFTNTIAIIKAADLASTEKLLIRLVNLFKDAGDWKQMNEHIQLLSKKHGQLKQAITLMVQETIKFLDDAPDLATKIETIENIRVVTEGKVCI